MLDPPYIPGISRHARFRARERYGQDFPVEAWLRLWLDVVERRSIMLKVTNGKETHIVRVERGGEELIAFVVYCPEISTIVTALPPGIKNNRGLPASPRRKLRPQQFRQFDPDD